MRRDPEQPRRKLRCRLVARSRFVHAQKNFLRELFRNRLVLHHPEQEVDHRPAMPLQQQSKTGLVPLPDLQHQFGVPLQGSHRHHMSINPLWRKRLHGRVHSSVSALSINSRMASPGERPRRKIDSICSVIGMLTPTLRAKSTAADTVSTPSATILIDWTISASGRPLANSNPTVRFRLSSPVHVSTRSPSPAKPASVRACPPIATANRVISANPRVINAALALLPSPIPWQIPAPIAITFFSAAPASTPIGSALV